MSGAERHPCSASPTSRRLAGGARICSGLWRLGALLLAFVMAVNLAHASWPAHLVQISPASVTAAPAQPDDPCRTDDCCAQECALSCVPGAAALATSALVPGPGRAGGATLTVHADVNLGSGDPLPPLHPPKTLVLA